MLILIQGGSREVMRRLGKIEDFKFSGRIAKQLVGVFSESNTPAREATPSTQHKQDLSRAV